ncbi:uncharacterized protein LOC134811639 [Bolinopsis microptera]|uniref:uncharacterized protein LOC134811639 n=1 Tax=Bolinopsis microptera TaxID=2820187 RepID=UPI003079C9F4
MTGFIRYGRRISFLLVFGFICFYLGSSQVNIPFTNVSVIQERNDNEEPDPSSKIACAKILSGTKQNPSDPKLETSLVSLQLPQAEENIKTDQLCPNTEEFAEENERKLDWIQSQCNNTVRSKLSEILEMFYFPKSLLGWCPVYKAASSSVFAHFCSDYFDDETCQDRHVKEWNFEGGFRKNDDFTEKDPPPKDEKRFLVVRDPFRRLLSLYRNKVELLSHPALFMRTTFVDFMIHYRPIKWITRSVIYNDKKKVPAWAAINYAASMTEGKNEKKPEEDNPYLCPPYPTFKEIVDATIAGWGNNHVIPASQRCGPCGSTQYDFLLKAETFDCDLKNMFNLTGNLRLVTNSERWMTNQTPALNMTMFYSYYSTLSTEQLDGLLYLYEDDCLLFQYPCAEHVENIKKFKTLNPNHKHEYKNTWLGIIGDPDIIS